MTKWFHSGRRRDLCALLYDAGELRAQSLKNRVENHYDERIDPGSFYATLRSLVESGFLERRTEGIADVYALTDAGERALLDHYEWLSERVGAPGATERARPESTPEERPESAPGERPESAPGERPESVAGAAPDDDPDLKD